MRKKIVVGNWKINNDVNKSLALISDLLKKIPQTGAEVMIVPTFVNPIPSIKAAKGSAVEVIAQSIRSAEGGAYTDKIPTKMLNAIGVKTTILGHSERRACFNETNGNFAKKVGAALKHSMCVVFCTGREFAEYRANEHFDVVGSQIKNGLLHLPAETWQHIILAYESIWAIGTGETASPEQAQEIHHFIRRTIADKYGRSVVDSVSILHGGSIEPDSAEEVFTKEDVDGRLIRGAAPKADDLISTIKGI